MTKEKPTIIIDTREKAPWDFEGDDRFESVLYQKLHAGDYSIQGMEEIIIIERKATADELFTNFTKNKERILAEFERSRGYKFRIMIIEETCEQILNPQAYYINRKHINKQSPSMPPAVVATNLTKLMLDYGVYVIFAGDKASSMARGILLHAFELHRKGKI
jgi:ERCC4-type nuclease